MDLKTCRFCSMSNFEHKHPAAKSAWVRYGPRHSAHLKCLIEKKGADALRTLPLPQLQNLPGLEIRELGMEPALRQELDRRGHDLRITDSGTVVVMGKAPKPKTFYLAAYSDPAGMIRAWGSATSERAAVQEADTQLKAYRDEKRAVGDPLADAEFTLQVKEQAR